MRFLVDGLEAPFLIIALGVMLAIAAPMISLSSDCESVDTINSLLDISQVLISGGLGGAIFKPLKSP